MEPQARNEDPQSRAAQELSGAPGVDAPPTRKRESSFEKCCEAANILVEDLTGQAQEGKSALLAMGLVMMTGITCTLAGTWHAARFLAETGESGSWRTLTGAIGFSTGLLGTLVVHEYGHYRQAVLYNVRCSLPIFIPAPTLAGTFGAAIRIKGRPPDRHALFDIASGGPLAGLLVCVPALVIGLLLSEVVPAEAAAQVRNWSWNESILSRALRTMLTGNLHEGETIAFHPLATAGNIGLFITAVNLLPIGPLDGGHITRAVVGYPKRTWRIGVLVTTLTVLAGFASPTWRMWGIVCLVILLVGEGGQIHPMQEWEGLDRKRQLIAVGLVVIMVLSFNPNPISMFGN